MATQYYHVPNISCMHCVRRITQALSTVPGVKSVNADVDSKQVAVTYEGADTLARVRDKLQEIGYPPAE